MNDPDEQFPTTPSSFGREGINPYASPESIDLIAAVSSGSDTADAGLVRHVLPVSILMIVQGSFELLIAIMMIAMAVIFPLMIPQEMNEKQGPPILLFVGIYGTMGGVGFIIGILHVVAGIFGLRFRRRVLGIVALASGIAGVFTCYCAPTGIALAIYGLIVYLNPRVKAAFDMGDSGMSAADVRAHFRC